MIQPPNEVTLNHIRDLIQEMTEGMSLRPRTYGTPSELEAIWHVTLAVESILLTSLPMQWDALQKAKQDICQREKWPTSLPFSAHVTDEAKFMLVLKDLREAYFQRIGAFQRIGVSPSDHLVGHRRRFFRFIQECGKLLGKSDEETADLLKDPSWFFCFDDGMAPEDAVQEYREKCPT
jgi:hypothetical protein